MTITIEVLDAISSRPAENVDVVLRKVATDHEEGRGTTDFRGRIAWESTAGQGAFRVEVSCDRYFTNLGMTPFVSSAQVVFRARDPSEDLMLAVVISPASIVVLRVVDTGSLG